MKIRATNGIVARKYRFISTDQGRSCRFRSCVVSLISGLLFGVSLYATADGSLTGRLTDPQSQPVPDASITIAHRTTHTDTDGRYRFDGLPPGTYKILASSPGFTDLARTITVSSSPQTIDLQFEHVATHADAVTVTADAKTNDIQNPDPGQRVVVRDEILDANPGRPGAPVSIPGLPIETASSGIKAPQYFAPGVAGDHGEPIASFIQVGSFLLPNNLSANAHGNGYSDPNIIVPAIIESVATDGGAFNVREGNHSVDLAATYAIRPSVQPFATLTGDYRDVDLSAGWKWLAFEAAYGNGFLDTLEHRQQYKMNALHSWTLGQHQLTALFLGYYGQSKIPGLVPIDVPGLHDTIDPRQKDQTHTAEFALNDVWHLTPSSDLQLSGLFRVYNLSLDSNFGDGLIRQSEFRTVAGGNGTYIRKLNRYLTLMAGLDYFRDAPRRDDLDHYASTDPSIYGPFQKVTANNITLNFATPFVAIDGRLLPWLHYNLGWRRDQIGFNNVDLLNPSNSFSKWEGINSPKATVAILPPDRLRMLPSVAIQLRPDVLHQ